MRRGKITYTRLHDGTWTAVRGPAVVHGYRTRIGARRGVRRLEKLRRAER